MKIATINSIKHDWAKLKDAAEEHRINIVYALTEACARIPEQVKCKVINFEDVNIDWKSYDIFILGAFLDYGQYEISHKGVMTPYHYLSHILPWLKLRTEEGALIVNGEKVIKFSPDKSKYLKQLEIEGIPIIPTLYFSKKNELNIHKVSWINNGKEEVLVKTDSLANLNLSYLLQQLSAQALVIKSADAMFGVNNFKFTDAVDSNQQQILSSINQKGKHNDWLIQRYMPKIADGEISFVYFTGQIYSFKKVPALGEFKVHVMYGGHLENYHASDDEIKQAKAAIKAIEKITNEKIYKARVDMVYDERTKQLVVMEVEFCDFYSYLHRCNSPERAANIMDNYLQDIILDKKKQNDLL